MGREKRKTSGKSGKEKIDVRSGLVGNRRDEKEEERKRGRSD